MEWSEEHDIILLREMISREIFSFKKGSPDRGKTWESIQEFLNQMGNPKFHVKEKRGVRDRFYLQPISSRDNEKARQVNAAQKITQERSETKDLF